MPENNLEEALEQNLKHQTEFKVWFQGRTERITTIQGLWIEDLLKEEVILRDLQRRQMSKVSTGLSDA